MEHAEHNELSANIIDTIVEQVVHLRIENAEFRQLLVNAEFYLALARAEGRHSDQAQYFLNVLRQDISKKLKESNEQSTKQQLFSIRV